MKKFIITFLSLFIFSANAIEPVAIKSYEDLTHILDQYQGKISVLLQVYQEKELFHYRADQKNSLGSVFKLYILYALIQKIQKGELSWEREVEIKEALKSLPNGDMQDLANGTRLPISVFASKMISISDNTATDHLLDLVGRNNVEKLMQDKQIQSYASANVPFLSTMDFFKTRLLFQERDVLDYVNADREARMELIRKAPFTSREDLESKVKQWNSPRYIEQIQWFATPQNICQLYERLDDQRDKMFRSIMKIRTPFIDVSQSRKWKYAGYKGGSEPGVLEMAYLLEDKKGKRYCLFVGQNDPQKLIEEETFISLVMGIFKFLETN